MKNLLNFLPTWKLVKTFLNVVYYFSVIGWFLLKSIMIIFANYNCTTNDIFQALMFISFFLVDIYDAIKNK